MNAVVLLLLADSSRGAKEQPSLSASSSFSLDSLQLAHSRTPAAMDALVNRPNHVLERQRKLQADPRFIHQKMPRANLYMRAYMTLFACGLGGALYGTQAMIRGQGKVSKGGE